MTDNERRTLLSQLTREDLQEIRRRVDAALRVKLRVADLDAIGRPKRGRPRGRYAEPPRPKVRCTAMTESGAPCHFHALKNQEVCGIHLAHLERRSQAA